jgi:hypothetical protein
MTATTSSTTDPATELWLMFNEINKGSGQPVWIALANFLGINQNDPRLPSLIGVMSRRCHNLEDLVSNIDDMQEHAAEIITAINRLRTTFSPQAMASTWDNHRQIYMPSDALVCVKMASQTVRRFHPLKRLSSEERMQLERDLKDVIEEVRKDGPTSAPIVAALEDVLFMLERFAFFGHAGLGHALIEAFATTKQGEKEAKSSTRKLAIGAIASVAAALVYSNDVVEAIGSWVDRSKAAIEWVKQEAEQEASKLALPAPLKMLTGPAKAATANGAEEVPATGDESPQDGAP